MGNNSSVPGYNKAIASLILGVIGVILWFFGFSTIISMILGIIGLVLASSSKKEGYEGGIRTAGFILSLIAIIGGVIAFIACVACVGSIACLGGLAS
ncbi:MAG: hypothetical protein IKN57_02855 [Parasporobacterium sp.]|nr:hypothetical protein [Parasporobacterium sp.]